MNTGLFEGIDAKTAELTRPLERLIVSVDLGQTIDPTAIAVTRARTRKDVHDAYWRAGPETPGNVAPPTDWYTEGKGSLRFATAIASLDVIHLERLPLRMNYPEQMEHVASLLRRLPGRYFGPDLLFDMTGVGRPIVQMSRRVGLHPIGVTITAGNAETRDPDEYQDWRVAKLLLVSRLQSAMHEGILRVSPHLKEGAVLKSELQDFRATFSETGYARFGAREGAHDDILLALAIGVWWATRERNFAITTTYTLSN